MSTLYVDAFLFFRMRKCTFGTMYILRNLDKVHIFWEGHKFLRNLHRRFVLCSNGQIYGGDFAKFCGLLRIYELYICNILTKYTFTIKVVPEGWAVTVSRLTLAVIFSITPFLYQSSSVCYAHSQMQKRSMVYLFWTMGYSDQAVRNKTFNSN